MPRTPKTHCLPALLTRRYRLPPPQAMVILLLGFKFLNKWWGGQVVGRLPFHPLPFFQKVTHRGLEGANATDCSAVRG